MKKQKVTSQINLERLAGGAFAEKLNEALMQVAENIQNPNTEATTKRQINIAIKFAPNKSRQVINTQISVTTKLAATEAIDTQMVMGVNMRTGQIEIAEYDGQIRGQMNLSDFTEEEPQKEEAAGQQEAEPAEAERDRETLFEVNALLPHFEYGREYDQESFLVSMQACFAPSEEREDVTKVASNIVSTQEATFSDDGISQQVVMKTGVTKKENAIIPNPVRLIPYRTFLEVEQPESEFVFRITEGRGGAPAFKLVSADGGRWEAVAVDNVKSYLTDALADIPNREQITIIA